MNKHCSAVLMSTTTQFPQRVSSLYEELDQLFKQLKEAAESDKDLMRGYEQGLITAQDFTEDISIRRHRNRLIIGSLIQKQSELICEMFH